jgi:elongation factor 2
MNNKTVIESFSKSISKEVNIDQSFVTEFVDTLIDFNKLIEQIAEPEYKEKWKVNIADGSVAFGSARDNWALSLPFMKKKGVALQRYS